MQWELMKEDAGFGLFIIIVVVLWWIVDMCSKGGDNNEGINDI